MSFLSGLLKKEPKIQKEAPLPPPPKPKEDLVQIDDVFSDIPKPKQQESHFVNQESQDAPSQPEPLFSPNETQTPSWQQSQESSQTDSLSSPNQPQEPWQQSQESLQPEALSFTNEPQEPWQQSQELPQANSPSFPKEPIESPPQPEFVSPSNQQQNATQPTPEQFSQPFENEFPLAQDSLAHTMPDFAQESPKPTATNKEPLTTPATVARNQPTPQRPAIKRHIPKPMPLPTISEPTQEWPAIKTQPSENPFENLPTSNQQEGWDSSPDNEQKTPVAPPPQVQSPPKPKLPFVDSAHYLQMLQSFSEIDHFVEKLNAGSSDAINLHETEQVKIEQMMTLLNEVRDSCLTCDERIASAER